MDLLLLGAATAGVLLLLKSRQPADNPNKPPRKGSDPGAGGGEASTIRVRCTLKGYTCAWASALAIYRLNGLIMLSTILCFQVVKLFGRYSGFPFALGPKVWQLSSIKENIKTQAGTVLTARVWMDLEIEASNIQDAINLFDQTLLGKELKRAAKVDLMSLFDLLGIGIPAELMGIGIPLVAVEKWSELP
jgi:hypothetical protein